VLSLRHYKLLKKTKMKKGLLFVGALVAFTFASCKKDFSCECTTAGVTYTYVMTETKKAAAYAACEGKGIGPITVDGVAVPDTDSGCKIK
jgi:hypothetical protein